MIEMTKYGKANLMAIGGIILMLVDSPYPKLTFFERLKLAFKSLFKGKTHTFIIEDPVDYDAWVLMKELKKKKKTKK